MNLNKMTRMKCSIPEIPRPLLSLVQNYFSVFSVLLVSSLQKFHFLNKSKEKKESQKNENRKYNENCGFKRPVFWDLASDWDPSRGVTASIMKENQKIEMKWVKVLSLHWNKETNFKIKRYEGAKNLWREFRTQPSPLLWDDSIISMPSYVFVL
jgi:hypothetical protein